MLRRSMMVGFLVLASITLSSCGQRISAEQSLRDAIGATKQIDRLNLHIDAVQNLTTEGMSMKQSSNIDVNLSHEPVEIYIDGYVKNALTKIDFSLYRNASSYYLKGFDLSEDWTEAEGSEIEELFEGSLMMDYDKPEVYLNLLLEDDNKMIAREEDDKIMITVTDPTEPTRHAIAQYLIDSVRETADEDTNLEALSITVSNMVIVLDADTKLVRSISMDQSAQLQDGDKSGMSVDQKLTVTYDQVDEAKIKLPDDLLEMIG